ncbi:MAG TPA: endonuclease/exonuclease/phosphatase family protein [Chitinophagaceae bacterium]|nr:endonuclease/exonuclease/phosphatase family protein [Chitinophagaceae bacterium]
MTYYKWILIYCCLWLSMGCAQKISPAASNYITNGLRILSYNIHHANPPSKPNFIDIEAIAIAIKKQSPDLVALQEIDVHTNRSGKSINEAEEIARLVGMKYYFAKAIDYDGGEYGVAILSKFPMDKMTNTPLPTAEGTGGEHRTLATANINLPGNKKIVFACTHLDAQKSDTNRLLQIQKIADILEREKLPVIIAGDFNSTPSKSVINILDKYFTRTCISDCGFTVPVFIPTKTIDFIAYKPFDKFTVIQQKVIDEQYASDHRPVQALLKLK